MMVRERMTLARRWPELDKPTTIEEVFEVLGAEYEQMYKMLVLPEIQDARSRITIPSDTPKLTVERAVVDYVYGLASAGFAERDMRLMVNAYTSGFITGTKIGKEQ